MKKPHPISLALALILPSVLLAVGACEGDDRPPANVPAAAETIPFRDDGNLTFLRAAEETVTIDIEIAETDSARRRGLMQRSSLPDRSGMLFVFDREEPQSFWMANTPIALDILFVDSDSQIVAIDKYTKPFSPSSITSDVPARYVVEVPAGFADTYGIVEGERVRWTRQE